LSRMRIRITRTVDRDYLRESSHYSIGNYIASMLSLIPIQILPILIVSSLGSLVAADYYISYSVAAIIMIIPSAFSTSLLVEGSHGRSLRTITKKSMKGALLLMVPVALLLFFFGETFLQIIGRDYISALPLLRIMIISTFLVVFCSLYFSILRVKKQMSRLIYLNGLISLILIISTLILIQYFGIIGTAYAWIVAYGMGIIAIGALEIKERGIFGLMGKDHHNV